MFLIRGLRLRIRKTSLTQGTSWGSSVRRDLLWAEVGAEQAVRQDALGTGQVVDVLARGHHLVGRQRVLVPGAAGDAADDGHDGVAVAEDLLDVVGPVELFEGRVGV